MPDLERLTRSACLHSCRSDYERQRLQDRYDALDKGRLQGMAVACLVLIPTIMGLTYYIVHY